MPEKLADIAAPFHHACLNLCPLGPEREKYQSIVCGARLQDADFKMALAQTGLLHLLIVSGSHIVFLSNLLEHIPLNKRIGGAALTLTVGLFALANRLEAIVIRAVLSLTLQRINARYRLGWSPIFSQTIAGALSLGFCHGTASLLSLQMSWICSLALTILTHRFDRTDTTLTVQLGTYLFIAPALLPFSVPHPASILCNLLLAPGIGFLLFPLSLMSVTFPWLSVAVDPLWRGFDLLMMSLASAFPSGFKSCQLPPLVLQLYLVFLTLIFWNKRVPT